MNILFLHPNFPAQFRHVATALAKNPKNTVYFGTKRKEGGIPGVFKVLYTPSRTARAETHHYVRNLENAVLEGQAVYRLAEELKKKNLFLMLFMDIRGGGRPFLLKISFPKQNFYAFLNGFIMLMEQMRILIPKNP
jgi:hypothetical protein